MTQPHSIVPAAPHDDEFANVVTLIESARQQVYRAVNTELIDLYWRIGEYVSKKIEAAAWRQRHGYPACYLYSTTPTRLARLFCIQHLENVPVF